MERDKEYKAKVSAQLQEWSAEVDILETRMENFTANMKTKRVKESQFLRAKRQDPPDRMRDARSKFK